MSVTVAIPCFNAERWIESAIESALNQTWDNVEVVVVDDGSTDGSLSIIQRFDGKIRWETGPNRGGNSARNRLAGLACGEWIQYLDADDYLLPDKIELQVREAERYGAVDVLYSPVSLEKWKDDQPLELTPIHLPTSDDVWLQLIRWELPQTGGALFRKSILLDVGAWNPDQSCCQEHELYLRLLEAGVRLRFCPTPRAVYRVWSENTVCRKNPVKTATTRLDIVNRVESFLETSGELTDSRRNAIAEVRFEVARTLFQYDRRLARDVVRRARTRHPRFRLPDGPAFPPGYRLAMNTLGFGPAEFAAGAVRRLREALGSTR